jgi:acetyl-CoA acetyltransferase family protein
MREIVIIDGARTPFLRSGTAYIDLMSYQLGQFAIKGVLTNTDIDPKAVDYVCMGTVISNTRTSNVAREAALTAGIAESAVCHTVTQACISANQAIVSAAERIMLGHAEVAIAGGVDCVSDTPIQFRKAMRKKLFLAQKNKTLADNIRFLFSLRLKDFAPDRPAVAEFLTGRTMGNDCDLMAARFGITRQAQDEFAARSHRLAGEAEKAGVFAQEIVPVALPPKFLEISRDNGIRPETTADSISRLKPAFDRKYGTITAANASFLTDGAAAVLLMSREKADALGLTPKARIVDYTFTGQRLEDELLLGPAYATRKLLERTGISLAEIDVFEFHEAFAGQMLCNLSLLPEIPVEKLNVHGGSLSIGHPFGATGARLMTTAANRLHREGGRYALIAACAAGAQGHAMIIERI